MADASGADRIWKIGAIHNVVKGIQAKLNAELDIHPRLVSDGIFGEHTESVVKLFQAKKGLKQDGIVGPITFDGREVRDNTIVIPDVRGPSLPLQITLK